MSQPAPTTRRRKRSARRRAAGFTAAAVVTAAAAAWMLPRLLSLSDKPNPREAPALLALDEPNPPPGDASPPRGRPAARAPGAPVAVADSPAPAPPAPNATNEQIHAALEAEKKRMGIRRILPAANTTPGERRDGSVPVAVPAPAIVSGSTPVLLSTPSASAPGLAAVSTQAAASPAPPGPGLVVHSEAERAALWAARGMRAAPPTIDWQRQQLAVLFAPDEHMAVEVAAIQTFGDRVVLQYRESEIPQDATRSTSALSYQFRVLPLSGRIVVFQKLR